MQSWNVVSAVFSLWVALPDSQILSLLDDRVTNEKEQVLNEMNNHEW
jgi:hypothetical protein